MWERPTRLGLIFLLISLSLMGELRAQDEDAYRRAVGALSSLVQDQRPFDFAVDPRVAALHGKDVRVVDYRTLEPDTSGSRERTVRALGVKVGDMEEAVACFGVPPDMDFVAWAERCSGVPAVGVFGPETPAETGGTRLSFAIVYQDRLSQGSLVLPSKDEPTSKIVWELAPGSFLHAPGGHGPAPPDRSLSLEIFAAAAVHAVKRREGVPVFVDPRTVILRDGPHVPSADDYVPDQERTRNRKRVLETLGVETAKLFPLRADCRGMNAPPGLGVTRGCPREPETEVAFGVPDEGPSEGSWIISRIQVTYAPNGKMMQTFTVELSRREDRFVVVKETLVGIWE